MRRKHLPSLGLAPLTLVWALGLSACGAGEGTPAGAARLSLKLTDGGCEPHDAKVSAGPIVVEIENAGTSKATEVEIMEGDKILGEEEDIADGLDGSFSVTLGAGDYTIYCPGGADERGTLTVTGAKQVEGATKGLGDTDAEGR